MPIYGHALASRSIDPKNIKDMESVQQLQLSRDASSKIQNSYKY